MPAALVAVMVLAILLFGLGAVLLATKALRAESDKVRAGRVTVPTAGQG